MTATTQEPSLKVSRIIGNNAVLAVDDDSHQYVALGRGVGFGVRAGRAVDRGRIEQLFLAGGDAAQDRLTEHLADVPLPCVRAAARVAERAHEELGLRITQALILPLADHLQFALQRAVAGEVMQFPLLGEVQQLYPAEFAVGEEGVRIATDVLGVAIDPNEAVALAMHLVNAQFSTPGVRSAMQMTETISRAFEVVEAAFRIEVDRRSMDAARFVTHLRYVFARVTTGRQISEPHPTLFDAISNAHPDAIACAMKVRYLIEMTFGAALSLDETAYLGLHVARLVLDHEQRAAVG